jgi:hypothetical protein
MVSDSANCNLNCKLIKPNFSVQLGFFGFGFRFRFGYARPDTAKPSTPLTDEKLICFQLFENEI